MYWMLQNMELIYEFGNKLKHIIQIQQYSYQYRLLVLQSYVGSINVIVTVQKLTLYSIADKLSELAREKIRVESKLEQYTDKMDQSTHRIVKVFVGQIVILNEGMALRPEEETMKNQLDILYNNIISQSRFKGKLTEIATLVRLKNSNYPEDPKSNSSCIPQIAEKIKHNFNKQ